MKGHYIYNTLSHDFWQDLCKQQGGILPEPRDEAENDFLDSLDAQMFVLGINDKKVEGQWVFDSDNTSVEWVNWAQYGSVNNRNSEDNCVFMVRHSLIFENENTNGHTPKSWSDYRCESRLKRDEEPKQLVCQKVGPKGNT